jgi:hypothetical protein
MKNNDLKVHEWGHQDDQDKEFGFRPRVITKTIASPFLLIEFDSNFDLQESLDVAKMIL